MKQTDYELNQRNWKVKPNSQKKKMEKNITEIPKIISKKIKKLKQEKTEITYNQKLLKNQ